VYFPIADAYVPIAYLVGIGFAVGVCGGFWGMGGGWMITPALYALGVPMNIAVGTDLAHIVGKSLVSTFRHFRFGNVSLRIALLMVPGTMVGVEIGAGIVEYLKRLGEHQVNSVISLLYIIVLGSLALFTFVESWRSKRILDAEQRQAQALGSPASTHKVQDRVTADLAEWAQRLRLPPMVSCHVAGIRRVSLWIIVLASVVTGLLAGLLGVGGGFLRMPVLVYIVGCPTHVAVGTDLFEIIVSGAYGTFTHGLKGNVDVVMAVVMLLGATIGAQVGTFATRYVHGAQVRSLFGVGILIAAAGVIAKTYLNMPTLALVLLLGMAGSMAALIVGYLILGILRGHEVAARTTSGQADSQ
jgi:uncharacterized membrane protein YfcA